MLYREQLHDYQKRGAGLIYDNLRYALFLGMGLGKTITTLTAIVDAFNTFDVSKVLIIAPKRVVLDVWAQEAAKWEHTKHLKIVKVVGTETQRITALKQPAHIYLIGRDSTGWLCAQYGGGKLPFDMLVIDESSSFKNHASKRFKALKSVCTGFTRVVLLTGTPAPNTMADLWAQIFLLDFGARLGRTITAFRNGFLKPVMQSGHTVYKYGLQEGAEAKITDSIADICTSMSAADYLTLPDNMNVFREVYFDEKTMSKYKSFEKEKVLELFENANNDEPDVAALNAAALYNKLLQCAGGAVYDDERNVLHFHSYKLDALEDVVESCNGEPILISWTYQHERDRIKERFKSLNPQTLDDKNAVERWNKGEIKMLLMHPASGGHGLNLQYGGRYMCFYSMPSSLELYQQIKARLDRQGQTKKVVTTHLVAKGTFDEKVVAGLDKKEKMQDSLLYAVKEIVQNYV